MNVESIYSFLSMYLSIHPAIIEHGFSVPRVMDQFDYFQEEIFKERQMKSKYASLIGLKQITTRIGKQEGEGELDLYFIDLFLKLYK